MEPQSTPIQGTSKRRWLYILGILTILASWTIYFIRDGVSDVDQTLLNDAKTEWMKCGIDSYEIEVLVTTFQKDRYVVSVQNSEVVAVELNGTPLKRLHAFETWSVNGMFETIARDLEHIENLNAGNTGPETCEILIKGAFDPRYHFPQKYLRFEIGGMNQTPDVSWEVSRFEPL
ncbi:MAG: DUF6174 domain-containing protein [Pirellulales bacterium]|nr:DUF6174 domain-containing protein [Pirellulales bacterium]